jgi:hypothetical protein
MSEIDREEGAGITSGVPGRVASGGGGQNAPVTFGGFVRSWMSVVTELGAPDSSGVTSEFTRRAMLKQLIRSNEVPGLEMENEAEFWLTIAMDAIINLSSTKGFVEGQTVLVKVGNYSGHVDRRGLYSAMFGSADVGEQKVTALHRGLLSEIDALCNSPEVQGFLKHNYGVYNAIDRTDYLRVHNSAGRKDFSDARYKKAISGLTGADVPEVSVGTSVSTN